MRSKSYSIKSILFIGLLIFININTLFAQNETSEMAVKSITIVYAIDNLQVEKDSATLSEFTRNLISNFPRVANIKLNKWKNEDLFYQKTEQEIFESMHIDAFFKLDFSISSNEISSVAPILVERNMADNSIHKIALPVYSINYYKDYDFTTFLDNELSGFVDSYFNINPGDKKAFLPVAYNWSTLFTLAKSSSSAEDYSRSNFFLNLLFKKKSNLHDTSKVQIFYLLGSNKVKQNRINEAEEEFNKGLAINPDNYWANFGIAKVRFAQGNYESTLRKTDILLPATSEVFLLKGQAYMGLKQYEDAERNFNNISSKSNPEVYKSKLLFLGSIYIENDESDKAYEIYKELYSMDSTNSNVAYLYGYLISLKGFNEFNNNNYSNATDLLLTANKVNSNADVTDYLRLAYINKRRFDDALEFINLKILEGEYSADDIYLTHALDIREIFIDSSPARYENINEFGEQVLKAIDLHLEFNPDDPNGYLYKGNTLTRLGRDDEGLAQTEIAFEKNALDQSVQLDLMELYILNNKLEEAENFYYKAIQNNKDNKIKPTERYLALMNYLLVTSLNLQNKKFKKPQKKLSKLLRSDIIIDRWSYDSYLSWLEKSNYNETEKSFLIKLTNEMKSHNKPG